MINWQQDNLIIIKVQLFLPLPIRSQYEVTLLTSTKCLPHPTSPVPQTPQSLLACRLHLALLCARNRRERAHPLLGLCIEQIRLQPNADNPPMRVQFYIKATKKFRKVESENLKFFLSFFLFFSGFSLHIELSVSCKRASISFYFLITTL